MRWRDLDRLNPSEAWLKQAADALASIKGGHTTASKHSKVWAELKPELSELSNGKCWYCESTQDRSDNAVDHFRPKSVYPLHAVSYRNFRFACSFCNSPHRDAETGETMGKSNHFPLFENSKVAETEAEIDQEQVILLDPCSAEDPGLLDFMSDGKCCPCDPDDQIIARRVNTSIKLYNLNHAGIVERRRLLALRLARSIVAADRLYAKAQQGDAESRAQCAERLREIALAVSDHSELSAFARRMLARHRDKRWVDRILYAA